MIRSSTENSRAARTGALAGLTAGALLTLLMIVMAASNHKDVWYGLKGAAAPIVGHAAMRPGFDLGPVLLGLLCHFAISAAWGALFGLAFYGLSRALTMLAGIAWGFVVWLGMYYVVLPIVGLTAMRNDAPVPRAIAFHLVFSIALAAAFIAYRGAFHGPGHMLRRFRRHGHAL
jgi:hypothetical protein